MSPCNYRDYHPDWKSISRQIREQAGDRCEFCEAPNHQWIYRDGRTGEWLPLADATMFPRPMPVYIVLTVAHLDHDKDNNEPANLRALCQRCHLRWDAKHHAKNAAETRRRKRIEAGQVVMEVAS